MNEIFEECVTLFENTDQDPKALSQLVQESLDKVPDQKKKTLMMQFLISRAGTERYRNEYLDDHEFGHFFYTLQCALAQIKIQNNL